MTYIPKQDTVNATITGDASINSNEVLTLNTVNSNVGTFGDSASIPIITVNSKGLITSISETVINSVVGTVSTVTSSSASLPVTSPNSYIGVNYNGAVTLTLPTSPANGTTFIITDERNQAGTTPITVVAGGTNTINKNYSSVTIKVNGGAITLIFRESGWFLI